MSDDAGADDTLVALVTTVPLSSIPFISPPSTSYPTPPSALPSVSSVALFALCAEPSVLLVGLHLLSHFVFLAK